MEVQVRVMAGEANFLLQSFINKWLGCSTSHDRHGKHHCLPYPTKNEALSYNLTLHKFHAVDYNSGTCVKGNNEMHMWVGGSLQGVDAVHKFSEQLVVLVL